MKTPETKPTDRSAWLAAGFEKLEAGGHELTQAAHLAAYCGERFVQGAGVDAARMIMDIQLDAARAWLDVLKTGRNPWDVVGELGSRTRAGLRYDALVQTLGARLFGTGKLPGEEVLGEDAHYRLIHIPAKAGVPAQPALFHVGGVLPYGDALFRILPELSFYERFTERGMPVYALELKPDCDSRALHDLNLEGVIDAVGHFSALAFDHAQGKKMVLEGYCGLASHALAYALARPLEANARFKVVATFVGPVDGTRCENLSGIMKLMPRSLTEATYRMAELTGECLSGDSLRTTQDLALNGFLGKTPLGRFSSGWKRPEYAGVDGIESLTLEMRKDLAGAYWISPENCRRWPVPVDLSRFSSLQFTEGVGEDLALPGSYHGRKLSLAGAAQGTQLQFVGFYGGKDQLVPEVTAEPMKKALGDRYTHIVHPSAGHVSYVFSPKLWDVANPKGLKPNPVDVVVDLYGKA